MIAPASLVALQALVATGLVIAIFIETPTSVSAFVSPPTRQYLARCQTRILVSTSPDSTDTFKNNTITGQLKREPPFPKSAYHLAKDEERLKHNFVSFIDQSIVSTYSQVARLVEPRLYARADQFRKEMIDVPPTIDDVAPPPSKYSPMARLFAWNGIPARLVVGIMSYLSFPFIVDLLEQATRKVQDDALVTIVDVFLPGVSIVLGTYFSLTISILYTRFARLQETVSLEAGLLALTCRNLLDLFCHDQDAAVEGVQCVADQIRTLVNDSRGREIMGVIYSDPYARILDTLQNRRDRNLDPVSNSMLRRCTPRPTQCIVI